MIYNLYKNSHDISSYVSEYEIAIMISIFILTLVLLIIDLTAKCYLFYKTGISWWKALIPFYNRYLIAELSLGEGFFFLLTFVPFFGWIYDFVEIVQLARAYGKSLIYGIVMYFVTPLRWLMSFDSSQYLGPQKL